jgi:peptide/nickel transport system substrate-binding protein
MDDQRLSDRNERGLLKQPVSRRGLLKGTVAWIAAGAAAPLAAACAPQQGPGRPSGGAAQPGSADTRADDQPRTGGTLKIAIIGEPPAMDPMFTTATITQNISWHPFEHLFERNESYEPVPFLAERYDVMGDGRNVQLTLRKGVLFHNDKEMTSADVVASLKRWMAMTGRGKFIGARVESIDARDKYTVTIAFKEPTAGILPVFLQRTDVPIIPEEIAEAFPKDKMGQNIGTGPYKFLEHVPDRYVRFGRWEKYVPLDTPADGPAGNRVAYIDELLFMPVPEDSVRADGVGTGEYDFAETLQPDQYDTIKANKDVTPDIVRPYYWYTPHFNKKQSMFQDPRLRQAVLAATQMEPMMKAGFGRGDFYRLDASIAAQETPWYSNAGSEVYNNADPEMARRLMREAGYNGEPVRWMSTKEYFYNYNMALLFKQVLEQVGFKIDLQIMDWATLVKRRSQPAEYDVFITGHPSYDHPILQVYLEASWPGFWVSEEKDKAVNAILSESDPQRQQSLIDQLQAIQWREVPCIKCGEGFTLRARRNRMKGYNNPPDWFFWNSWLA